MNINYFLWGIESVIRRYDTYLLEGRFPSGFGTEKDLVTSINAEPKQTHENLRFPEEHNNAGRKQALNEIENSQHGPKSEVETFSDEIIHKNIENNLTAMADIINGNVATVRSNSPLQVGTTKIEMGVQSQLLVAAGTMAQLYFEITNTRTESVYHTIQVNDERSFLQRLQPESILLPAGAKTVVNLSVYVPGNTAQGVTDHITFTCHAGASGSTSLSVNLKVSTTADIRDTTTPTISWTFGNRCDSVPANSANCAEHFWTMDLQAQDWETGILRLQSSPDGLIYRNTYTVGSTEPIKAAYIATCCEPKVSLVAYDVAGNQRTYNVDVRDIWLTDAAIAAIVLGVLLLVLLIALVVVITVWRCRRRKVVLDMPTYRSHSTRSME